jgi:hypothetical protein
LIQWQFQHGKDMRDASGLQGGFGAQIEQSTRNQIRT